METCIHFPRALSTDIRQEPDHLSSASSSDPLDLYNTFQYMNRFLTYEESLKNLEWPEYLQIVNKCTSNWCAGFQWMHLHHLPAPTYEIRSELSSISTVWPPFASAIDIVRPASPQPIIKTCYLYQILVPKMICGRSNTILKPSQLLVNCPVTIKQMKIMSGVEKTVIIWKENDVSTFLFLHEKQVADT